MSNEVTKLPSVSPDEPASEGQEKMLKEIGKWKDGLTKDEATKIISEHIAENQMEPGIRLLRIDSIETAAGRDGKVITDKDGNPAIRITFRAKPLKEGSPSRKISDIYFYPKEQGAICKSAFKLRNLKKAMNLKPEEEQSISVLKEKKIWGLVQEVHHIDESGNAILDHENKPVVSSQLLAEFYDGTKDKPIIAGDPTNPYAKGVASDKFYGTKIVKPKAEKESGKKESSESPDAKTEEEDWG
jgi:hypothetical protein